MPVLMRGKAESVVDNKRKFIWAFFTDAHVRTLSQYDTKLEEMVELMVID